jgi:hypothetical protein
LTRHPSSTVARVLLLLAVGAGAFSFIPAAQGQGVPPPTSLDGGPKPRAWAVEPYRADGGMVRAEKSLSDALEFLLGFNPLTPSPEELQRKAAKMPVTDAGTALLLDASVPPPDGGLTEP